MWVTVCVGEETIKRCKTVVGVSQTPVSLSMATYIVIEATELGQVTSETVSKAVQDGYGEETLPDVTIESAVNDQIMVSVSEEKTTVMTAGEATRPKTCTPNRWLSQSAQGVRCLTGTG